MKTSTIKQYNGQKVLMINDITKVNLEALFIESRKLNIPLVVKTENGSQQLGLFSVADMLGYADCSVLSKKCNS